MEGWLAEVRHGETEMVVLQGVTMLQGVDVHNPRRKIG